MKTLLMLAGLAQLGLVVGSFWIPKQLNWEAEIAGANKLIRQMFWTYGGYLLGCHFFFGVISLALAAELLNGSSLSKALLCFMALWWGVRLALHFTCFDRSSIPSNRFNRVAEALLVLLFVFLTASYGAALAL